MNPAVLSGTKDSAVGVRRVDPSQSLLRGMPYVNAASTDIRARFERMKAEAKDFCALDAWEKQSMNDEITRTAPAWWKGQA